jgi:filamentous hemagglutinin family protein
MQLNHSDVMQLTVWALVLTFAPVLSSPSISVAQITTSITSTPGAGNLGTGITQAGNTYNISGGTRPGGGPNLFHSFGNFSIGAGDIGNFLNNTGLPTSNILGRVTGGNISNIYGTIQTTGFQSANLFLMNPAGFLFGPNASLNVGGSVSFTTAQYIRLFDGVNSANFYANPANDGFANSILAIDPSAFEFLSAAPAAYGFQSAPDPNATITVQGSALSVPSGQSISLIGGKVVIEGANGEKVQPTQLSAPNGKIQLATAASPGEFDVNTLGSLPNVDGVSFTSFGSAILGPGSSIDVHGANTVWIKGGQLVLSVNDATLNTSEIVAPSDTVTLNSGSSMVTSTSGGEQGADIQITVKSLSLDGSSLTTETSGDGNGGNIMADVVSLSMTNGAAINSNNFSLGLGRGGNLMIEGLAGTGSAADAVTLSNSASFTTQTTASGGGGDLFITSNAMHLDTTASINSSTFNVGFGDGAGGNIFLNVGTLTLGEGAVVQSLGQTLSPGVGQSGNITIQGLQGLGSPAETVKLSPGSSVLSGTFGSGDGGQLVVTTKSLTMQGATINASTFGEGRGGDIVVNAQQLSLSGGSSITSHTDLFAPTAAAGGTITVQGLERGTKADTVSLTQGSGINSEAFGEGKLGDIQIHAKTLTLADASTIQAGTQLDPGTAGNVTIDADSVSISSASRISSQAFSQDAGVVNITTGLLTLDNGTIDTATHGLGRGGDVMLNAGTLNLSNGASINSSTNSSGSAGNITIGAGTVSLSGGSKISSASLGTEPVINFDGTTAAPGRAGNVTIHATGGFQSDASTVATSAEANHGGDISITAGSVQLANGTLINANSNGPLQVTNLVLDQNGNLVEQVVGDGNAGNITVNSASSFVIQNSSMTTEASQASGGQITINTPQMVQLINSNVSTSVAGSSTDTAGGNISIDPQFVILQGSQVVAQAFAGTGGNITITSNVFLADPNSLVDASSALGISGAVDIRSPVSNISGVIGRLPESVLATQALLRAACAARLAESKVSSFVERGRDHIPVGPEELLATPYLRPSSEPMTQMSSGHLGDGRLFQGINLQVRPHVGDLAPIYLLSVDTACHS